MLELRNAAVGLALLAASIVGVGPVVAAPIAQAYVTTSLNLRAGPDTDYPVVVTMRAGDPVTIYGCLTDWTWCDIDWQGYRGWAAGQYLQVVYDQQREPILSYGQYFDVPFLSFSIGPYWRDHYRNRRFYGDIHRYEGPRGYKPPPYMGNPPKGPPPHFGNPPKGPPQFGKPHAPPPFMGNPPKGPPPHFGNPPKGPPKFDKPQGQPPFMGQPPKGPPHFGSPKGMPQFGKPNGGRGPEGPQHNGPPPCPPNQHMANGACQ